MTNDIFAYALLLLMVGTIAVRYFELRDLVKSIKDQTDALSLYLGEQAQCRIHTASDLNLLKDACARIEEKVDRLHPVRCPFDRRAPLADTSEAGA